MKISKFLVVLLTVAGLTGCGSDGSDTASPQPPPEQATFSAQLRFTEYGIPHVSAADWGSLGYGQGYAYASQNYCVLMREVVVANGQSQRFFGADGDLASDFVFALLGTDIDQILASLDADTIALIEGYIAGFNRYLNDTGPENLASGEEGCRDAPWVREISLEDYAKVIRKLMVRASTDPLAPFIFAAQPPTGMASISTEQPASAKPSTKTLLAKLDRDAIAAGVGAIRLPRPDQLGSNAYAVGSEATQNGRGALLGNPHFPWQGSNRFTMTHLTLTAEGASAPEYDVMGAALHGLPLVVIGFNADVAWTHTVSTGSRFVLYELQLNPDNPMQYEYDGQMRDITAQAVTIDVQDEGGSVQQQSHTFYFSHYGPIVDLGGVNPLLAGWPVAAGTGTIYAVRDINLNNIRGFETWRDVGRAESIVEMETALANIGIPWVNTIATDRAGQAFYGDISAVANVSDAQRDVCVIGLISQLLNDAGLTTLDGSNADCELGTDQDAPISGIIGYQRLPKLVNSTFVANANDSYWLSNPNSLLTGFPSIIGDEEIEQSLRTRLTFLQMQQRLDGSDGLGEAGVSPELLQDMLFGSRNLAAELVIDDVRSICANVNDWSSYSSSPAAVEQACGLLDRWDTRHNNDSVGAHIFHEFWRNALEIEDLWSVPFDATDPVNTPNTLSNEAAVVEAVRQALADGVQVLLDNNIALDANWGSVQFSERNGERIPIHGGSGAMLFSVITSDLVENEGYSDIRHGNSYMQTVSWDTTDCPLAFGLLSYSQSTDPASPHYADQTSLYSDKQWVDMPYCEQDIVDSQQGETITLEEFADP